VNELSDFPTNDPNNPDIKKRARRRLVGATVLALLAVIVLPLAMNNSDAPHTVADMRVLIPERDESPQLIPESDAESAGVAVEPDVVETPPAEIPLALPESSLPPSNRSRAERPASTPPATQPAREQLSREQPRRTPSHSSATAAEQAEAARVLALLNGAEPVQKTGKNEKTTPTKAQAQFFIQVSAFSDRSRAAKQVEELKKQGFAAYAEKAGKVTRVRIGPLSRSEGEQVVARLKAQGRHAVLSSR